MRSFSIRFVTKLRSTARRCAGCFPSFDPDLRCLIVAYRGSRDFPRDYIAVASPSEGGGAVWLGSGGQIIRPCSSNFMPRLKPILVSISLISLSDFLPKFFVFRISFSLFCTSSRIDWIFAFFRQL